MHTQAYEWVARYATDEPVTVLDIGGRDLNGTTRDLFPNAKYTVLDLYPGANVDIVADAASWLPDEGQSWDIAVCSEVFEHTVSWPAICVTAHTALAPGGRFVATMAGPGRAPHSGIEAVPRLRKGEFYENVQPDLLRVVLEDVGFTGVVVQQLRLDVRCTALRPTP